MILITKYSSNQGTKILFPLGNLFGLGIYLFICVSINLIKFLSVLTYIIYIYISIFEVGFY